MGFEFSQFPTAFFGIKVEGAKHGFPACINAQQAEVTAILLGGDIFNLAQQAGQFGSFFASRL
jgi:hypothetical protein